MFFCGNHIGKVINNIVPLEYNLNGELFSVICAEENEYITFIAICTPNSEFEKEIQEYGKILSKEDFLIYDKVTLPDIFMKYLEGNDVTILGCGDRIEIYKEGVCVAPLDEAESNRIVDEVMKHLDKLGL